MKYAKIVLVAEWDGWCGPCAAERPLVLTRTGRQRLRTWLTGAADDSRPLVLTCRLCGTGVDVPREQDDPPVELTERDRWRHDAVTPAVDEAVHEAVDEAVDEDAAVDVDDALADEVQPAGTVAVGASETQLTAGRQAVAQALGALLTQRSAATTAVPVPRTPPALTPEPAPAPTVPTQRTASSGGLAELRLLADGIDLLSSGRP